MREDKNNIDDCFKQLGEFDVPPPASDIVQTPEEEAHPIDEVFNSKFTEFEPTPRPEVWQNIQEDLPLHPVWKKRLIALSRIAAVLVLGLLFTFLLKSVSEADQAALTAEQQKNTYQVGIDENSDSVFDLNQEQDNFDEAKASQTLFGEEEEKEKAIKKIMQRDVERMKDLNPIESISLTASTQKDNPFDMVAQEDEESLLAESNAAEEKNITISIPLRVIHSAEEELIWAQNNQTNPAQ